MAPNCPLMQYVLKRYGRATSENINPLGAQMRTFHFYMWCARRVIFSYCCDHSAYSHILIAYDDEVRGVVCQLCQGDESCAQSGLGVLQQVFADFDEAIKRDDHPGWVHWLGSSVLDYINDGPSDRGVDPVDWMLASTLPAKVLTAVHEESKPLLQKHLGIRAL